MEKPKILIVGTVPYQKNMTSRAFEAYFHGYASEKLAQIFSYPGRPVKGHCHTLYQITDQRLVLRRFRKRVETGVIYRQEELEELQSISATEVSSGVFRMLYRMGKHKTPLNHLLRGWVWKKKYWCTDALNRWLDDFSPECVFLAFSDDFFILQLALYVARRFQIPILPCIGDDYYFNDRISLSPFYYWYRLRYRKLVRQVFACSGSAVYISDKIRNRYDSFFGRKGETVYLPSEQERRPFSPVPPVPKIAYFGNIGLGRYRSLYRIGKTLEKISPQLQLDIYSNENLCRARRLFARCQAIRFYGAIPYAKVQEVTKQTDILVVAEGLRKADINAVRYSLSTKAADALTSGAQILVYGSREAGVVEYLADTGAAVVCTQQRDLEDSIRRLLSDREGQKYRYEQGTRICQAHHTLQSSTQRFYRALKRMNIADGSTTGNSFD